MRKIQLYKDSPDSRWLAIKASGKTAERVARLLSKHGNRSSEAYFKAVRRYTEVVVGEVNASILPDDLAADLRFAYMKNGWFTPANITLVKTQTKLDTIVGCAQDDGSVEFVGEDDKGKMHFVSRQKDATRFTREIADKVAAALAPSYAKKQRIRMVTV